MSSNYPHLSSITWRDNWVERNLPAIFDFHTASVGLYVNTCVS